MSVKLRVTQSAGQEFEGFVPAREGRSATETTFFSGRGIEVYVEYEAAEFPGNDRYHAFARLYVNDRPVFSGYATKWHHHAGLDTFTFYAKDAGCEEGINCRFCGSISFHCAMPGKMEEKILNLRS